MELLSSSLEEHLDPNNELLLLLSRWNSAERDALSQLITREAMEVQHATITKALLIFMDDLKTKLTEVATGIVEEFIIPDPPVFEGQHQVLFLYAKEDAVWLEKLNKHLFMLKRQPNLHFVDIHNDLPAVLNDGVMEYQEKLIDVSYKVLCLLTPNCLSFSIYPLIEKAAKANKLIPIKLETVDTIDTVFHSIQGLPSNQKFVNEWGNENGAFVDVVASLRKFFQQKG